jgi:hypothetical protein
MRATGLEKAAQPYTALYFTDPGGLRTRIPLGHVAFVVAFTVQNETQTTNTYNWTVELVDGKRTTRAAAGQQIMRGGIGEPLTASIVGLCQSGLLEVVVSLASPAESIHYTVPCGE